MRLAVFGATGPTGQEIVREALRREHEVVAVARRPDAIVAAPGLVVVKADVTDPQSTLAPAIEGVDAVLSALGTHDRGPTEVYSLGAHRIVEAMNAAGVRRLVCVSSEGLEIAAGTPFLQSLATKYIVQRLYRNAYADMRDMEAFLGSSSIDWTVVRAPMLRDGASSGSYRVALDKPLPTGGALRRSSPSSCSIASTSPTRSADVPVSPVRKRSRRNNPWQTRFRRPSCFDQSRPAA